MRSRIDYRVLQPNRLTDPNGNRSDVAFDALARVAGTAVMGKQGENVGDSLEGFVADLPEHVVLAHLRDPLRNPWAVSGNATTPDLDVFAFDRTRHEPRPQPAVTYSLSRETHVSDLAPGERTKSSMRSPIPTVSGARSSANDRRSRDRSPVTAMRTRDGSVAAGRFSTTRGTRSGSSSRSFQRTIDLSSRSRRA